VWHLTRIKRVYNRQSIRWMEIRTSDESNTVIVRNEAAESVFASFADRPVNLVSIFGAARQGKSFLLNAVANQDDLFRVSNFRDPCTHGIDLAKRLVRLSELAAVSEESEQQAPLDSTVPGDDILVGFADAEGQGDRDMSCTPAQEFSLSSVIIC
jgi:hypothetical protein